VNWWLDPSARGVDEARFDLLFLHGWGVGPPTYGAALRQLRKAGLTILAPYLPGFGRTAPLRGEECSFAGFARWVAQRLAARGIDRPLTVVGHSFGGGVAVELAYEFPHRVSGLLLCNPVGVPCGANAAVASTSERSLWDWCRAVMSDLRSPAEAVRLVPALLNGAVHNVPRGPSAIWRVANLARRASLLDRISALSHEGVPIEIVWSERDEIVPHSSFRAMCDRTGLEGTVVAGGHCWLITHPDRFVDLVLRFRATPETRSQIPA